MAGEFEFIEWLRGQQAASELVAVLATTGSPVTR